MRTQGRVVRWDDARGFGFIRSAKGSQDIFFHARDFRSGPGVLPRIGLDVTFDQIQVGGEGPRAMAVHPVGSSPAAEPQRRRAPAARKSPPRVAGDAWLVLPLMAAYAAMLAWGVVSRQWPWWVLPASFGMNLFAFFAYWQDKYAAEQRQWRTPEDTLHVWSLAGGWGGAWFAQRVLRHKSRKASFRGTYWVTVIVHCAAVGGWLYFTRR